MITDSMTIYLFFQIILFVIVLISNKRIPLVVIFVLIFALFSIPSTIIAFGDYWIIAVFFLLINTVIPLFVLINAFEGD